MRARLFFLATLLIVPHVVSAQAAAPDEEPVLARVLVRRLDRLAATPDVKRLRPGATGMTLLGDAPLAELGRLSDSALVAHYAVLRRTLEHAPVRTCAATWTPGQGVTSSGFVQLAASTDSTLAEEWAELIAQLAEAGVRGRKSGGERATAAEMQTAIAAARARLPAADQGRLARLISGAAMGANDQCAALRAIYRGYGLLPAQRAAAVLRAVTGP